MTADHETAAARILLAGNCDAGREAARRGLAGSGFEIIEAANEPDAARLLQKNPPDLLVIASTPENGGAADLTRYLNSQHLSAQLPILRCRPSGAAPEPLKTLDDRLEADLPYDATPREWGAFVRMLLRTRRAETALRKRNDRFEIVSKTTEHLLAAADPNRLVSDVFALVSRHLDVDCYFNFMVNEAAGCLELDTCAGITEEQMPKGSRLAYGDAICGLVGREKRPIHASFIQESDAPMVQLVKGFGIRAYACNPLMAGDRLMGTLSFATRTRDAFTADELDFLQIMCHHVALAKEKIRMLNAAHAANRRKDEFIANMSHEMRTPMNVVLGLGYILANSAPLTEKQKTCITTLQASASSLLELINDLLDIAKIESNSIELEHVPFSLYDLADEVVRMMRVRAEEKRIDLRFDFDLATPRHFLGDAFRLRQVLVNLLSNAIKFTEKGSVELSIMSSSDPEQPDTIEIAVADTGIGIPDDRLDSIFNKFDQLNSSTARIYGGTGLGLTITKAFVELMKGKIGVRSRLGKGTVFTLTLPLPLAMSETARRTDTHAAAALMAADTHLDSDAPLVLLAEDHFANQLVASELLTSLGYRFEVASNGREAVEKAKGKTYDAILMDVQMPEMDGLEATKLIRHYHALAEIVTPIIGITAYASSKDKDRCLAAGMDDYISKPFNPDELLTKLSSIMDRKRTA